MYRWRGCIQSAVFACTVGEIERCLKGGKEGLGKGDGEGVGPE